MSLGPVVLLVYAVVMLLGGLMGHRAGSRASLIAGSASGLLLLAAWFISRSQPAVGFWTGATIGVLLSAVFGMRLAKTGKLMPAGALLVVSLVAAVLLTVAALRA